MTRHASVHAAGVVIAPKPITEFAPLYKGARDEITTQWGMKEIERIGLLKMDFLGLSTLTLLDDAVKEIERTTGRAPRPGRAAARRREDLRAVLGRPDARRVPVRELGNAGDPAQGAAAALRGPDRPERPLPPRPAARRDGGRLHQPQARPGRGHLRPPAARADAARDLRRHRLPGAGDAHRQRARRLHARRGRPAAQGDGEEGRLGHAGAAPEIRRRGERTRHQREEGGRRCST